MDIKLEITSLHWSHVRKFNWENFHERKLVALYWTLAFSQKGPINSCLSTYASRRLCVRLFKISDAWKLLISFFFYIWHSDTYSELKKLVGTEFWRKCCFALKWAKWAQNGPQMMFFAFFEKFCYFSWK